MNSTRLALAAALATVALGGSASALEMEGATVTFNAGVVSDYVFRGVSQSDEEGAIQGGVDVAIEQGYAGVWASNVDFGKEHTEVDIYGGVRPEGFGWNFDFGAIYYAYPGEASNAHEAYVEFKAAASRAFGPATVGAAVYYSPDFFAQTDEATYYELNGAYAFNDKISASGAIGRQDVSYNGDYTTWNVGATWAFAPHLAVDLRYHDTDEHGFGDLYESRGVIGLKAVF